ncbi:MAG: hypothetical protein ACKV19_23495 [Verrucomicrobiales bacterium]
MKKALLLFAFTVSASLGHGAAVTATKSNEGTGSQRPISSISGAGILTGGAVAIGSWAMDPVPLYNQLQSAPSAPALQPHRDLLPHYSW